MTNPNPMSLDLTRVLRPAAVDPALARNLVLALSFLKDADTRWAELQPTVSWTLPAALRRPALRNLRTWDELLAALAQFDSDPANDDFAQPFATLALDRLQAAAMSLPEIVAALDQLPDGQSFEILLANTPAAAGDTVARPSLARLMAALLFDAAGSVCDPLCREGETLAALLAQGADAACLFGQDRSPVTAAICRLRLALRGVPPANIRCGDSLIAPQFFHNHQLRRFDRIGAVLPPSLVLNAEQVAAVQGDVHARFQVNGEQAAGDTLLVEHVLATLAPQGKAILAVGQRLLRAGGPDRTLRQRLVESGLLRAVIMLPPGLLSYGGAACALLVIDSAPRSDNSATPRIGFLHAGEWTLGRHGGIPTLSAEQIARLVSAADTLPEERHFCTTVTVEAVQAQQYSLLPAAYLDFANPGGFLGGNFATQPLGQIAELLQGLRLEPGVQTGDTPILLGRNLADPNLSPDDLERVTIDGSGSDRVRARSGDVLIQRLGTTLAARLAGDALQGVLVAHGINVIRLHADYAYLGRFLAEFLNSARGQSSLSLLLEGDTVPTLTVEGLARLLVPLPDHFVTGLLEQLHAVEQQLADRLAAAQALRRRLFAVEDAETAAAEMLRLNTEAQILAESIVATDDLGFRIRNFYPFPLAYGYRMLDALPEPALRYPEQLRVAENLLAFLACVGLGLADHLRKLPAAESHLLGPEALRKYWQSGVSPGDWQAIARHCGGLLRNTRTAAAADSYGALWFRRSGSKPSDFAAATRELVGIKNDFKHDRGPKNAQDYAAACTALQGIVDACLAEVAFLIQYPIRLVQNLDIDWRSNQARLQTLVYSGDHPGLRQEDVTFPRPLPEDHLYLAIAPTEWVSLYPLISVQYCPSCRTHETYFVDLWDAASNRVVLKSFERGHTLENDDAARGVAQDLEHWLEAAYAATPEP